MRGAAGKELRIEEVNDVVNGDHGPASERRQDVVGRVEEVEAVTVETERETRELGQGVARRQRHAK